MMGMIKLEPPCPSSVNGLSIDPNPNWSFNDLLAELSSLESKLSASGSSLMPTPFTKSPSREIPGARRRARKVNNAFVMRVTDVVVDESDGEDGIESSSLVPAARFNCNNIFLSESEDSEDEAMQQLPVAFVKTGVAESAFRGLTHENELAVKEEVRNQLTSLETHLVVEREKSKSAFVQVEKAVGARREMDRKLDMHYDRNTAEALDKYMTAIQRNLEHLSQMEERKIRDDAAVEEAKRKEKALHGEKLRQQKAKAEEEARREAAKQEAERLAAAEAESAKEAAEKLAKEKSAAAALAAQNLSSSSSTGDVPRVVQSPGNLLRAAENALKLEERRLQSYKELEERNQSILSTSNMDLRSKERNIVRCIKQISGTVNSVRSKVSDLVRIFNDPAFPQSVTVAIFANKVICTFERPDTNMCPTAFACSHVIVSVSAQVPGLMNHLLAEFHKSCMYTVPKHIFYSKDSFQTLETYYKAIGFREEGGYLETEDQFLERLRSYMRLYGALVQTQLQGVQNPHGLEEGWMWLARFLNTLPADVYTATALEAFLEMAGFALHRRYKGQFMKIIKAVSEEFVKELKTRTENRVIGRLEEYIRSRRFLKEPVGWQLQDDLTGYKVSFDDARDDHQQQYHQSYNNQYQQQYHQSNSYNRYF